MLSKKSLEAGTEKVVLDDLVEGGRRRLVVAHAGPLAAQQPRAVVRPDERAHLAGSRVKEALRHGRGCRAVPQHAHERRAHARADVDLERRAGHDVRPQDVHRRALQLRGRPREPRKERGLLQEEQALGRLRAPHVLQEQAQQHAARQRLVQRRRRVHPQQPRRLAQLLVALRPQVRHIVRRRTVQLVLP